MASVDTKPIKDSCARLTSILGYHSNRSSAQKDDLWGKTYKNRQFKWKLQLVSADKAFDDDYEVTFACLPPSEHQAMVKMTYPESMKSVVLKFKKGTPIEVTGTLKEYENPPDDLADKVSIRITAEPKN